MKKRVLSVITVLAMLASLMVPSASAQEYIPLTFEEAVTVTLTVGESAWYSFTPSKTGTYAIRSYDETNVDPVAALYNSSMELLAENDDDEGSNFCIIHRLTAGETYYLQAHEFNFDNEGSYQLIVTVAAPTDVFFDEYSVESFVGEEYQVGVHIYPEDTDPTLTWTSSDESIATVDNDGTVHFLSAGEVSIQAETINGLTDTCYFTVMDVAGTLSLNTEIELLLHGEETRADTQQYFKFIPEETGYYRLYSYDIVTESGSVDVDPRAWVFDKLHNELEYDDDGGEDVNVSVEVALQAGETYYFMLELYDSAAVGSYKAKLEEMVTADSVSIDGGDLVMEQGNVMDIYVTYSPEGSWQEDYVLTSSDESIVKIDGKTARAVAAGEATVTVTTDLGLTDSIIITVIGVDTLELDTTYTLSGNGQDYGASKRYAFTPTESGRYTIASSEAVGDEATVWVSVSDISNELRYNNMGTSTFSLTYELLANETYYYSVSINSSSDSTVDFALTKEDDGAIPAATINTPLDIDIVNGGDGAYYVFTPRFTGLYAIYSTPLEEILDTAVSVYNADWDLFYSNDDGGADSQYRLEEEFTAGETYYIKSIFYSKDQLGNYTMTIEPLFDLPVGDVDGDGVIDTTDARLALYASQGLGELTDEQLALADMNGDGTVNSRDVRAMLRLCMASEEA